MSSLEELFCQIDDFCRYFEPQWHLQLMSHGLQIKKTSKILMSKRDNDNSGCVSSASKHVISNTITSTVSASTGCHEFPRLRSYQRFVERMPSTLIPLCVYLNHCFGKCTGISFIDATSLKVCHNRRISQHRVLNNLAARGRTSVDWFFGFNRYI